MKVTSTPSKIIRRLGDQTDVALTDAIERISMKTDAQGRPFVVTLWHRSGAGTRITSTMHDVSERIEVGVLSATRVDAPLDDEEFFGAPTEFSVSLNLTNLFVDVERYRLESGFILTGRGGRELVIVSGAYPYSLALGGFGDAPHRFEPEYPLDDYKRLVPL